MKRCVASFFPVALLIIGVLTSSFLISPPSPEKPKGKEGGVFFTADGLLWQASEPDLTYATKSTPTDSLFHLSNAKAQNPNFRWEFGFRAGLVFRIPHGGWDTYLNYTWFQDRATDHANNNDGSALIYPNFLASTQGNGTLLPVTPGAIFTPTFISASAEWKLRLQIADWEFGKKFSPNKWFAFRPHAGIRASWVQQNYDITYVDAISAAGVPTGENVSIHMTNDYWGVGIRAGFDSQWFLSEHWSLYGNAAVSLLWGAFDVKQRQSLSESDVPAFTLLSVQNIYNAGRAISDLQLGLRWQTTFREDRYAFSLQAGWEQHVFFEQNEFMHFTDVSNAANFTQGHGDLSVQGATVAARFDF